MSAKDINRKVKIDFTGNVRDLISKLKGVGTEADRTKQKLQSVGGAGATGLNKVGQAAKRAKIDLTATAVAVQGMTASIGGMAQQVLDFESKIIALQKTIVGVKSQELALKRQQEDLNRAVAEGTITQRDYERTIEDIGLAYQNMILEQRNVEAETKKLNGEYVNFGINAVGTTSQVVIAFTAMGISAGSVFPAIVTGIKGISAALWTVAKHPVFLIITAGILAWELGLKSIVEELTGIDDLGIFSNMEKAFAGLTEGPNSMEELDMQTKEYVSTVEKGVPVWNSQADSLERTAKAAEGAEKEFRKLSVAQEIVIRNGGFSSGRGTTLSSQILEESDAISAATARTLAAASLHEALKTSGITGSLFGRNVSGQLTTTLDSMRNAGRVRNSFTNSGSVFGTSTGGVSLSSGGFGGLTRSSQRRRSGRSRNPFGRNNKFSVHRRKAGIKMRTRLNKEFGFDFNEFTGVNEMGSGFANFSHRFRPVNIGNGVLSFGQGRARQREAFSSFLERQETEGRRRIDAFRSVTSGTSGIEEAMALLEEGFGVDQFATFDASQGFINKIQDVIQARNFFRGKGVDFDGMQKSGISGLLNIREFGYREMNDQLAFLGQEQYQTVGT